MESRDRKKNDCSWFWAALDRPLTDAQRNALRTLFAPAGKAGGKQEDVRLLAYALRGYVLYGSMAWPRGGYNGGQQRAEGPI